MMFYRMTARGVLVSASTAALAIACSAGSSETETQSVESSALSAESAEARPPRGEERICKEYATGCTVKRDAGGWPAAILDSKNVSGFPPWVEELERRGCTRPVFFEAPQSAIPYWVTTCP